MCSGFLWCHHIYTHMRTSCIIEKHSLFYSIPYLLYVTKHFSLKQFILHRVIDSFSLCIVFGISILRHTDSYTIFFKQSRIFFTGILASSVRMMNYFFPGSIIHSFKSHSQSMNTVFCFKSFTNSPSDNLLTISIQYQRQITESVLAFTGIYRYISNVTYPQSVYLCWYICFCYIGICKDYGVNPSSGSFASSSEA